MTQAYLYRLCGLACCVALITNVYKHGWHVDSVALGLVLAALTFSLGVGPERRTLGWELRYVVTAGMVVGLAAFRFLR